MDSYYFALIAQGIKFYSKVIFSVVSWYSKCRLYFIKVVLNPVRREKDLCVCSFQRCFCDTRLFEGILKVSINCQKADRTSLGVAVTCMLFLFSQLEIRANIT